MNGLLSRWLVADVGRSCVQKPKEIRLRGPLKGQRGHVLLSAQARRQPAGSTREVIRLFGQVHEFGLVRDFTMCQRALDALIAMHMEIREVPAQALEFRDRVTFLGTGRRDKGKQRQGRGRRENEKTIHSTEPSPHRVKKCPNRGKAVVEVRGGCYAEGT